jgi:peptide/nickel transport system substrate-binding protein
MSNHVSRRHFIKLAGIAAAAATLSPVSRALSAPRFIQTAKTFTIGINAELTTFDPQHSGGSIVGNRMHGFVFDQLTQLDPAGQLQPMLATAWKNDGMRWVFTLRPNVKFHDGTTMTAQDVAFSINRMMGLTPNPQPSNTRTSLAPFIEKAEVTGDLEVAIITKIVDGLLPLRMASVNTCIVPEAYYSATTFEDLQTKPIGAGPFKLVSFAAGDRSVMEAHADYWGGRPNIDQLVVRPIPETATRMAAFQAGELDLVTTVPPDSIDSLGSSNTRVETSRVFNWMLTYFNTNKGPTANVDFRRALSLSIDRKAIAESLWGGRVRVMNDYYLPGEFGYDEKRPDFAFDLDAAKKALDAAKYAGEALEFTPPAQYYTNGRLVTDAINEFWTNAGITVTYEPLDNQNWFERSLAGNNIATLQSFGTSGDPGTGIGSVWAPGLWIANYFLPNEASQKLLTEAASSTDADLRRKNYRAFADYLDTVVPIAPLYQSVEFYGVKNDIKWTPSVTFQIDLRPNIFSR